MSTTTDYIKTDRNFIYNRGNNLNQATQDRGDRNDERAGFYGAAADEHYIPILEGQGGYSPNEQTDIMGRDRLNSMYLGNEAAQEAYLTPDEQTAIRGNQWNKARYFNPSGDMEAVAGNEAKVNSSVDQMGSDLNGAIDPHALSVSSEYSNSIDPTRARMSQDFVDRYRMTPEQKDALLRSVARDSTAVSQNDMQRVLESARASGMDPMGMASYGQRANRQSRQDTNRALADARVQADNTAAGRELNIENTRLGAEQNAGQLAQMKEDTRLGANRDIATRKYDAASETGQARVGAATSNASREQQQRQFNTQTGTNLATEMENSQTGIEANLAKNRQAANQQNRNDIYDRQKYVDAQVSGRTAGVANTRRADEKEARGYLVGARDAQNGNAQAEYNRQAALYGTQGQFAGASTGAQQTQDNQPKWWEKALSAAGQVATGLGTMGVGAGSGQKI